jgi:hypothetical protein
MGAGGASSTRITSPAAGLAGPRGKKRAYRRQNFPRRRGPGAAGEEMPPHPNLPLNEPLPFTRSLDTAAATIYNVVVL